MTGSLCAVELCLRLDPPPQVAAGDARPRRAGRERLVVPLQQQRGRGGHGRRARPRVRPVPPQVPSAVLAESQPAASPWPLLRRLQPLQPRRARRRREVSARAPRARLRPRSLGRGCGVHVGWGVGEMRVCGCVYVRGSVYKEQSYYLGKLYCW